MVAHTYNPREAEVGGLLGAQGQPGLHSSTGGRVPT